MKFKFGKVYQTRGIAAAISESPSFATFIAQSLQRYARCDWGDLDPDDARMNDEALHSGDRILAAYIDGSGNKIYIITECDRSVTTVLFPDEY